MNEPCPVLLVIVPPDWTADESTVHELRRRLTEGYRGVLSARASGATMRSPVVLHAGVWTPAQRRRADQELRPLLERAWRAPVAYGQAS